MMWLAVDRQAALASVKSGMLRTHDINHVCSKWMQLKHQLEHTLLRRSAALVPITGPNAFNNQRG